MMLGKLRGLRDLMTNGLQGTEPRMVLERISARRPGESVGRRRLRWCCSSAFGPFDRLQSHSMPFCKEICKCLRTTGKWGKERHTG